MSVVFTKTLCARGHSAGHFGTKMMYLAIFDGVIANSVIHNMHYEKLNLLIKLISKSYIQSHCLIWHIDVYI